MFPSIRSQTTTNGTTATTTPVVNLPATIVKGDTIWVVIRNAAAGAIGWPDANWQEVVDDSPDAAVGQTASAWKKAVGNEGGTTITLSSANGKFAAAAWAVQDAADPTVTPPEISTVATGTTPTQPNATTATPTGGAKDYLWLTFFTMEGEATGITGYPSNYTLGQSGFANSGTGGAVTTNAIVAGAARTANAASEDAGAWNIAGTLDDWSAYTVAFHPAVSDLSANVSESVRVFDRLTGASRGIATAMLAVGLFGDTAKLADYVQAAMDPPPFLQVQAQEAPRVREFVYGAARQAPTDLSAGLMEGDVFHLRDAFPEPNTLVTESVKADDGGFVELFDLGGISNPVKVTDGPINAVLVSADDRSVNVDPEQVKVADVVLGPTIDPEQTTLLESSKVADEVFALLGIPVEILRSDDGGFVELIGLGNPVKIADGPVSAALVGEDLAASASEIVKIADAVQTTIDPEQTALPESLKVADSVQIFIDPEEATPGEVVRVSDTVQASVDLNATPAEALKVVDAVQTLLNPEEATPGEVVKITDLVQPALIDAGSLAASVSESLKVVDGTPLGFLDPTEQIRVDDGGFVELRGLGNPIKISDSVSAALFDPNLLQASVSESLKVVDQTPPQASLVDPNALSANPSEIVKVADQVTAALVLNVLISESLKVSEGGYAELVRDETVKVADSVTASLQSGFGPSTLTENVKVVDAASVTLNPEQATPSESVKCQDQLTVVLGVGVILGETVKCADAIFVTLNPEETNPGETVKVTDSVSAAIVNFDLSATLAENVKVQDLLTAVLNLGIIVAEENVKVQDAATTLLNPLRATPSEDIKVQDQLSVASGTTLLATVSEALKVADAAALTLDPEEREATEAARISDTTIVTLNPEETAVAEAIKIQDSLSVELSVLVVNLSESVEVVEETLRFGGPRVINVIGGYSGLSLDVVGGYGEGE